jgi:hypothetical protein
MNEFYEYEKSRGEVVNPDYFDKHIAPEINAFESIPVEELERRLRRKDGSMRGMYSLDDLEKMSEREVVNMFGVWGEMDPLPDDLLDKHVDDETAGADSLSDSSDESGIEDEVSDTDEDGGVSILLFFLCFMLITITFATYILTCFNV